MNGFYILVAIGAAIIVFPVLFSPAGWLFAGVLLAIWLAATFGGKMFWDVKMNREQGMRNETSVKDRIAGSSDDRRWRRR